MLSKKMKRPALAVEIKTGRPGAHPGADREDDDEYNSLFGEGGDDDQPDDGEPDGDESGDPEMDDHDGDEPQHLSQHVMERTSLADATYEQLMAAAEMKKPADDGGDQRDDGDMPPSHDII